MLPLLLFSRVLARTGPVEVPLTSVDLSAMSTGWGSVHKNLSVDGHSLSIGGRKFAVGVGTHAHSEILIKTAGNATRFRAWVGVDDEVSAGSGSVRFHVIVDGADKASTKVLHSGDAPVEVSADLSGAKLVQLVADETEDGIAYDHADWADAFFQVVDGAKPLVSVTTPVEPTMKIAHVDLTRTEIHGAREVGCTPGHDFIFRIPATGRPPLKFEVTGLPPGLGLDPKTGIVTGIVSTPGDWLVNVKVSGPGGQASRQIRLAAGDHWLALTPPMGWNSWNVWGTSVTADKVRAAADSFQTSHLADFGYTYVNIDDAWEGARDANGEITTNGKFGDMATLATYVHNMGLKLGIYSSPGPKTCAGYTGSYQHEKQDAQTYAKWGVDYLKYDWCSFGGVPHPQGLEGFELPYKTMRAALDEAPRDIVFSMCQYGMGDVYKWGHVEGGGNLWRTTGDINDTWGSMSGIGFSHTVRSTYVKPGGWNDPDMLVVGRLGWGDNPRPTHLTSNEQITHISLWSLLAAPLIIGCDLTQLDQFTKDVLMNPDVIDIDQDPLGKAATRAYQNGSVEVWSRPLWDGSYAIGLFNRGPSATTVHTLWTRDIDKGAGPMAVRELWTRHDTGRFNEGYSAAVPSHGAVLIKVTPIR